ncbi:MAG: hypothetical protein K5756_08730 [Clostridiales bacterium]|nr:hypothetical protein [Clostridiales bacterium]
MGVSIFDRNSYRLCDPSVAVADGGRTDMLRLIKAVINYRNTKGKELQRQDDGSYTTAEILGFKIDGPDCEFENMCGQRPFITVIDDIHTEYGKLRKKLDIIGRSLTDLPIIINGDRKRLRNIHSGSNVIYSYGIENQYSRFKAYDISWLDYGSRFSVDCGGGEYRLTVPFRGRNGIYGALAAFAVGYLYGIDPRITAGIIENRS